MTTLIFIENVLGSGQIVKLTEDFGDHSVCRELQPGDSARVVISPFKSVMVREVPLARPARLAPKLRAVPPANLPMMLQRRLG